jgi:hypothetical protein
MAATRSRQQQNQRPEKIRAVMRPQFVATRAQIAGPEDFVRFNIRAVQALRP